MTLARLAAPLAALLAGAAHGHPAARHPAHSAAATSMIYFGGPVIPNARVYLVWWGGSAAIDRALTAAHGGVADLFSGLLDSPFMDQLAQYSTGLPAQAGAHQGQAGTGQLIGRGTYAGAFDLPGRSAGAITDADLQAALEQAAAEQRLPAPDAQTIYAVVFPQAVAIGDGSGGVSCQAFGGYHSQTAAHHLTYLVLPDCRSTFDAFTALASHELAEAVTDPIPTPGSNPDWPQAWNDSMGNEIGDLCDQPSGYAPFTTAKGTFEVQLTWDQRSGSCSAGATLADDFAVSFAGARLQLGPGATAQAAVQVLVTSGAPGAVTLTVAAPAGLRATLDASTLQGAHSTTVLVMREAGAAAVDAQVVVSASAGGVVRSAALLVAPAGAAGGGCASSAGPAPFALLGLLVLGRRRRD